MILNLTRLSTFFTSSSLVSKIQKRTLTWVFTRLKDFTFQIFSSLMHYLKGFCYFLFVCNKHDTFRSDINFTLQKIHRFHITFLQLFSFTLKLVIDTKQKYCSIIYLVSLKLIMKPEWKSWCIHIGIFTRLRSAVRMWSKDNHLGRSSFQLTKSLHSIAHGRHKWRISEDSCDVSPSFNSQPHYPDWTCWSLVTRMNYYCVQAELDALLNVM